MASFNKVILLGNLARDPRVGCTRGGFAFAEIGLVVNRGWFDLASNSWREEEAFVEVMLSGRNAENAGDYLSKGRSVLIEGRLQMYQWEDRETGKRRSRLKVVAENMQILSGIKEQQRQTVQSGASYGASWLPEDEIPF